MLRFSGAGVSDVGLVRPDNEDSGFVGPTLAVVADGVGGAAAGEVASATATAALVDTVLRHGDAPIGRLLGHGAEVAGAGVRRGIQSDLNRLGMATTLTAVVTDGCDVVLGHVGDSRAYLLRDGRLTQLSRDHTYVQDLVERGQLDAGSVRRHPWRNVVLRSVDGDPIHPGIDIVPLDVRAGDRLLLCSDGLSDLVPDDAIGAVLGNGTPAVAARACVDAALAAGGRDNVTCVVVDVVDVPSVAGRPLSGELLGAVRDAANVVDANAALRS